MSDLSPVYRQVHGISDGIQVDPRFRRPHSTTTIESMDSAQMRLLYGRKEAARQLSVSVRTLDAFLARGEFRTGNSSALLAPTTSARSGLNPFEGGQPDIGDI